MTVLYPSAQAIEAIIPKGEDWGIERGAERCLVVLVYNVGVKTDGN